jgi:hypothetical protein
VYQPGDYQYCLVFHAPSGKEFAIDIIQQEINVTVKNVDAQLTPEQEEERRRVAEETRKLVRERLQQEEEEKKRKQ